MTNHRYRLTFGKGRELRFTGHLDLHRAFERTFRRSGMSLAYSEGFNPRPKINIGAALPLGCTSGADLVDIELTDEVQPASLEGALQEAAPPGLSISLVEAVGIGSPKLQKLILSAEYSVRLSDGYREALSEAVRDLMSAGELVRRRRDKEYDLRPLVEDLRIDDRRVDRDKPRLEGANGGHPFELRMQLAARSSATGRPDEVLLALEIDPVPLVPHRTRLILRDLA